MASDHDSPWPQLAEKPKRPWWRLPSDCVLRREWWWAYVAGLFMARLEWADLWKSGSVAAITIGAMLAVIWAVEIAQAWFLETVWVRKRG